MPPARLLIRARPPNQLHHERVAVPPGEKHWRNPHTPGARVENKLTKYGHFIPFVVVYPYETEHLCPADWCHLQDRVPLVEGRETGCLSIGYRNRYRS